jgi:hypothetical protein
MDFIQAGAENPELDSSGGLVVEVNHRESADWPSPHVHPALAIPWEVNRTGPWLFNLGACHALRAGRIPAFRPACLSRGL